MVRPTALLFLFCVVFLSQGKTQDVTGLRRHESQNCLPNSIKPLSADGVWPKEQVTTIDYGGWNSSRGNAWVSKILLEELRGFKTNLVAPPPEAQGLYDWEALAAGTKDAILEVWWEGRENEFQDFLDDNEIIDIQGLGVSGSYAWYMPSYAVDDYEAFASYRPFQRCEDVKGLVSNNTDGVRAELAGAWASWKLSNGAVQQIRNNGLCLQWVDYGGYSYLRKWEEAVAKKENFLFAHWEPTALNDRYKYPAEGIATSEDYRLTKVSLKGWTDECQAQWKQYDGQLYNGTEGFDCAIQNENIKKYMTARNDLHPELEFYYRAFSMRFQDHTALTGQFQYNYSHSNSSEENAWLAACHWIQNAQEANGDYKWSSWFWQCPNDCSGQGECVGGSVSTHGTCKCKQGFEGDSCQIDIADKYFYCSNGSSFVDPTGVVRKIAPDLRYDPTYIPYDLKCDEIIDCDSWEDEEGCSPSVPSGVIGFAVIVALSMLLVITSLMFILTHQERGRIRAAGVVFLVQIHVGILWGMSSTFMFFGKASDTKCGMAPWWIAIPMGLVIGSLVAKQWKVWKVMNHTGFQVLRITNSQLFAISGGIVAVDLLVLIIWSAIDLPYLGLRKVDGSVHPICDADNFLPFFIVLVAYKFIIILVSAVLAWKSRKLPSAYSESKHIGFALYNAVFLMVIFIPIILATNDQPFLTWILVIVGLWFWFFSIYLIVVGFIMMGLYKERNWSEMDKNNLPEFSKGESGATSKGGTALPTSGQTVS